ncbi:CPBP family intramembrane glutamic endopeptidase [Roseinatronobacter alkalisoli]|uniref:CPBP family intramembrane metalloprotease n=1 Tax=Roseinatronobacter alkalisoli TaxID=3028235 RepID=A0ABT5T6U2_9RHOB|nr:CPBP family intramembrane glutamic endopeptidase [Roseinatronobacter sp. HJB301]MDD7970842.1 CPBP family intramembrane metalloprotease [Roseinatronobacter sp. HJB301]
MTDRQAFAELRWRYLLPPLAVLSLALPVVGVLVGFETVAARYSGWFLAAAVCLSAFAPVAALALASHSWRGCSALALVVVLWFFNIAIATLPQVGPFRELDWNWQGKTLDLAWMLGIIVMLPVALRREIGWTWRTNAGSLPVAFINIAIMVAVGFFVFGEVGPIFVGQGLSLERVLFDTTYPNLVEEIIYRGFMLALLDRAFPPRWHFSGAKMGWGVVLTAWLFGLVHGITPDANGTIVFDPLWLVATFVAGLMFGWIRALTGSLWPAFLAHCAPEVGILFALAVR